MITPVTVKRIILCILALALAVWLIFLLIPRTNRYQYDCMLNAEYEYDQMEQLFGGAVHVTTDLKTTVIFNRMYISGEITIQDKKYNVSENQFYPRSVLAHIKTYFDYAGTMMRDFNSFDFHFDFSEPELKEYDMSLGMTLTHNRISLEVSKIERRNISLAYYTSRLE